MIFWIFFSYFVSHSWGIPMMKITGLSHLFKWENLHNCWLTKYFFAPLYLDILKQSMIPSLQRLGRRAVFQHDNDPKQTSKMTTALLKKLRVKAICGASSDGRWRIVMSLTSTSSVMSAWRSGRGLQWQPVKLWWKISSRQCWWPHKILTLWAQFWHFHLGVYYFCGQWFRR